MTKLFKTIKQFKLIAASIGILLTINTSVVGYVINSAIQRERIRVEVQHLKEQDEDIKSSLDRINDKIDDILMYLIDKKKK